MLFKATQIAGKRVDELFTILLKTRRPKLTFYSKHISESVISDYTWHSGFQKYTKMKQSEMRAKPRYTQEQMFK